MDKILVRVRSTVLFLLSILMLGSASLQAQGIEYKEESRMRLDGLGLIGRLIGRTAVESKTYVQGAMMRVDSDKDASTISDMEAGRFITLNHKAKEYTVITFEDMVQMAEQMREGMKQEMEEAETDLPEEEQEEEVTTKFEFEFDAKATGESEEIAGYAAEQLLMTLKVIFEAEGEDEEGEKETVKGNFFAFVDHWASDEVEGYEEIRAYQQKAAERMGQEMGASGLAESMQQAFQADPRMAAAMTRIGEEMAKVEGMPLRSTTYLVIAPEGAELDVDAVLGKKKEKKGPGLGGLARGALRGRGITVGGEEKKDEQAVSEQKTLLSIATEMKEIKAAALDGALFQIPSGYKEVKFEGLGNSRSRTTDGVREMRLADGPAASGERLCYMRYHVTLTTAALLLCWTLPAAGQDGYSVQIARIKYGGGGDWYSDELSLVELLKYVRSNTLLDVGPREDVVELTTDKVFQYPYLYLTGHGNVVFSESETARLRRYLLGGGFLHIDDNYGLDVPIRREMKRVFPEYEFVELPWDHPIYHAHFSFPEGLPKIHEHDGKPAQGFGIVHEGRLLVFYSYESDLGDGWEPPEVHNNPPEKRLAALQMGTNILVYAMRRPDL